MTFERLYELSDAAADTSQFTVKNTFVDVVEPSIKERFRKLKPHLSCNDVPDPIVPSTGFDLVAPSKLAPTLTTVGQDSSIDCSASSEELAYTGSACAAIARPSKVDLSDRNLSTSADRNLSPRKRTHSHVDLMDRNLYSPGLRVKSEEATMQIRAVRPRHSSTFYPWVIQARRLQGFDRVLVSPPIEAMLGSHCAIFRLIITPKLRADGKCINRSNAKGGMDFRKSEGWGTIQVKCESVLPDSNSTMSYQIWVGSGDKQSKPRGPVHHDFGCNAVSELPAHLEQWNFGAAIDSQTSTLTVRLEQLPPTESTCTQAIPESTSARTAPALPDFPSVCATPDSKSSRACKAAETRSEAKRYPNVQRHNGMSRFVHVLSSGSMPKGGASHLLEGMPDMDWSSSDESSDDT